MECDVMGGSGGINVYEKAWEQMTREKSFEGYVPERVCIALDQNGGAPCRPTVLPGEYVFRGQVIGEPACEAGSCVHASISGYVEEIYRYQRAPGVTEACVKIRKSAEKHREWRPFAMAFEKQDIRKILYRTGVDPSRLGKAGTLIVNGFANEPYITSGYRLMMESPGKIVIGAVLGAMAAEAERIYICINEDAFDAVARVTRSVQKYGQNMGSSRPIRVISMKHRYPGGNEKIIVKKIPGRQKDDAVVVTVAEMAALYDGVYDGEPWTRVGITVSGEVAHPKNLWVPIGTNIQDIVDYCGGKTKESVIIHGGPMRGCTVDGPNAWVTKQTCGLLVLRGRKGTARACIHCGRCREVCPQGLMPDKIEALYLSGKEIPESYRASECIRCGLCSYVCPSGRRLTEYMGQVKKGRIRGRENTKQGNRGEYIYLKPSFFGKFRPMEVGSQSAPHIHRRGTVQDVMKQSMLALVPVIAGALYQNQKSGLHLLLMLLAGVLTAVLSEYFWQMLKNEYLSVGDYSAAFTGLLLPLLFPLETPLWKIFLATASAVIIGKQIFGGIGRSPVHPVLVGKLLFSPYGIPLIENLWFFAGLSCVWMFLKRMYPPFYSLAYLAVLGIWAPENLQSASVFLAAAFLIWNYETMLPSKTERWIFTLASAAVTLFFREIGAGTFGLFFAIALMSVAARLPDARFVKRI